MALRLPIGGQRWNLCSNVGIVYAKVEYTDSTTGGIIVQLELISLKMDAYVVKSNIY